MKILHWEEMFHPSFGYQINILAKFQAMQGHDVTIMSPERITEHPYFSNFAQEGDLDAGDAEYTRIYGVKIIRMPWKRVVSGRVIYKRGYIEKIKSFDADIVFVHTNDTISAINIARKHKRINKPLIFDNHMVEVASENRYSGLFRKAFRTFVSPIVKKNKWIVFRTQDIDFINKAYGLPEELTPFLSFGTDTTLFHPDDEVKKAFRAELDIADNDFVVVYTGKINEGKGGKLFANTIKDKFPVDKNIVFIIVGSTSAEYGKEVEPLFAQSENRVIRFPTQEYQNLAKFYQAGDLSVFPHQSSLSFYDAQACELPVISDDDKLNVDRVAHGNGFSFKTGDINDFRDKILKCAQMDCAEYDKMKKNSYDFVINGYDYADIARECSDIMEKEIERFKSERASK